MVSPTVYFVPAFEAGHGTGHLFRCLRLAAELQERRGVSCRIRLPQDSPVLRLFPSLSKAAVDPETFIAAVGTDENSLFVLDMPNLDQNFVQTLHKSGPVCALDPGGKGREYVPFVIDTLPNLYPTRNVSSPWFLRLPEAKPRISEKPQLRRVLISLGGEDGAGLTVDLMRDSGFRSWLGSAQVDVLLGPANSRASILSAVAGSWHLLPPIPNLADRLGEYDLVVSIFGLTAFESMAAGTPVLLVHPSPYHKALSRNARLPELSQIREQFRSAQAALPQLLEEIDEFQRTRPDPEGRVYLEDLIEQYAASASRRCPACGTAAGKIRMRFAERSFLTCPSCRIDYQILCRPHGILYSSDYFDSQYKKQYGRTYLEDFPKIREQGRSRLQRIQKLLKRGGSGNTPPAVLDIGCAYGPFMLAAQDEGMQVKGIDVSAEPIDYVTNQLHLDARCMDIGSIDLSDAFFRDGFDVLTLWYVIEHFPDLDNLFKKLTALVRPGGVLAIATPSGAGVSARRNLSDFLRASPMDHFTIWNPKQARKTLERIGFRLISVVPASFHPERYPKILRGPVLAGILRRVHKAFNLGDTMELYAIRKEEASEYDK